MESCMFAQSISSFAELMFCSPKLYFVKVDVQACFDTIEQDKLLEILKDIISRVRLKVISRLHYLLTCSHSRIPT